MPLERSKEEYLGPGLEGVRFLVRDGAKEVACSTSLNTKFKSISTQLK